MLWDCWIEELTRARSGMKRSPSTRTKRAAMLIGGSWGGVCGGG